MKIQSVEIRHQIPHNDNDHSEDMEQYGPDLCPPYSVVSAFTRRNILKGGYREQQEKEGCLWGEQLAWPANKYWHSGETLRGLDRSVRLGTHGHIDTRHFKRQMDNFDPPDPKPAWKRFQEEAAASNLEVRNLKQKLQMLNSEKAAQEKDKAYQIKHWKDQWTLARASYDTLKKAQDTYESGEQVQALQGLSEENWRLQQRCTNLLGVAQIQQQRIISNQLSSADAQELEQNVLKHWY